MKYFRFLLLASVVSLVLCMHIPDDADEELELETADQEGMKYCNDWAVEIHGGMEMANKIADKHGFINLGQVHISSSNSSIVIIVLNLRV